MALNKRLRNRQTDERDAGRLELNERVDTLLATFDQQISGGDIKISVTDYIRLIQFKQDLDKGAARNVEVRWVDTMTDPGSNGV